MPHFVLTIDFRTGFFGETAAAERQAIATLLHQAAQQIGSSAPPSPLKDSGGHEIGRYEFQYEGRWPIMLMFYRIVEFSGEPKNRDFEQIVCAARDRLREYDFLEGDAEFLSQYTA